jgi:hypothetical protein
MDTGGMPGIWTGWKENLATIKNVGVEEMCWHAAPQCSSADNALGLELALEK